MVSSDLSGVFTLAQTCLEHAKNIALATTRKPPQVPPKPLSLSIKRHPPPLPTRPVHLTAMVRTRSDYVKQSKNDTEDEDESYTQGKKGICLYL